MSIGIVLVNFNSTQDTIECLKSLNQVESKDYGVFVTVVDNHSEADDLTKLSAFAQSFSFEQTDREIEFIWNTTNFGFTGGNNIGITNILNKGVDYILLLNNDTFVAHDFLTPLIDTLEKNKNVGAVVPKIYFAKGYEFHKSRYKAQELGNVIWYAGGVIDWKNLIGSHRGVDEVDTGQFDTIEETDYATGACMLIRSDILQEIGLFDDAYFLYYEDSDLSIRIKRKYSILYIPASVIWHKNAGSTGGSGSHLQDYFITRNRMIFGMRYSPLRTKIALLKESMKLISHGRMWQKRGIRDYYLRKWGKGSYPVKD
jgi:GT2 family glycosyltransferase